MVEVDATVSRRGSDATPGLVRVCCVCGSVRRRDATWERRPEGVAAPANASHGLCPACYAREYAAR